MKRSSHVIHGNINVRMREKPILKMLDIKKGEKMLDVGCGLGYFLLCLEQKGLEVHGIDTSIKSVDFVKKNITPFAKKGNCLNIPYTDNSFDKVLFCEVIEHIENDDDALIEIARILKPGGKVIISTPALEGYRSTSKLKQLGHHHGGEKHARDGYLKKDLEEKMKKNGYEDVKSKLHMFLLSELMMELTKWVFLKKNKGNFEAQSDLIKTQKSWQYKILKLLLLIIIPLSRIEDAIFIPLTRKGHALLLSAIKPKI